jgi:hypothetical protein
MRSRAHIVCVWLIQRAHSVPAHARATPGRAHISYLALPADTHAVSDRLVSAQAHLGSRLRRSPQPTHDAREHARPPSTRRTCAPATAGHRTSCARPVRPGAGSYHHPASITPLTNRAPRHPRRNGARRSARTAVYQPVAPEPSRGRAPIGVAWPSSSPSPIIPFSPVPAPPPTHVPRPRE